MHEVELTPRGQVRRVLFRVGEELPGGQMELLATEPGLARREIGVPVTTTAGAALAVIGHFATDLVTRHRNGDFSDLWGLTGHRISS